REGSPLEEALGAYSPSPLVQIINRRAEAAAAYVQRRIFGGDVLQAQRAGARRGAGGPVADDARLLVVPRVGPAEGGQNALPEEAAVAFARNLLHDARQDHIAGVAVSAACAWLEQERLVLEGVDQLVERHLLVVESGVVRVGYPRFVAQEVKDTDFVCTRV